MSPKFCGNYCGKYNLTVVENGINKSKGKVSLQIKKVGKDTYLLTYFFDNNSSVNILGFVKDNVIISENQSGQGITYTYFDDKYLVSKDSNRTSPTWSVRIMKFKKYNK